MTGRTCDSCNALVFKPFPAACLCARCVEALKDTARKAERLEGIPPELSARWTETMERFLP